MLNANEIKHLIEKKYGSLQSPDFSFVKNSYKELKSSDLVWELAKRFYIKDSTDLNDHVSLQLDLHTESGNWLICFSFLGCFCVLFRLDDMGMYEKVITKNEISLLKEEKEIIALCLRYKYELMQKELLGEPVRIQLFNTDIEETNIYHAMFSDDGIVPEILI